MTALMDIRVERNVPVPMRDGVVLRADVFRPEPEGRYPVLLSRTPYSKSVARHYAWLQPIRPASEGYVVVVQDVRGRFESGGIFRPFHQEITDGFDTVEWAACQPWSNGRVGMYGPSYLGATQWLAAAAQPPNLQAIVPSLTASDFHDGWIYQGGAFALGCALSWAALELVLPDIERAKLGPKERKDLARRAGAAALDHWPALRHLPLKDLPAFSHEVIAPYYREWLDHPTRDAYWAPVRIEDDHPRVHARALNIGGWFDVFARGTMRNFTGMRENGPTPEVREGQKLIVGPWTHNIQLGSVAGETVFGLGAELVVEDIHLRWFDRWLKDKENGIDREPPVRVFTMGVNRWVDETDWPPPRAEFTRFYLHSNGAAVTARGDGTLSVELPGEERPDHFVYDPLNPCPTLGGPLLGPVDVPAGQFDQRPVEERADVLCYSTPPLNRDTEVTGPISAALWVASTAPDTDFTAKLVDVAPDGTALNLCDGIIRARYRDGFDQVMLLPAGVPAQVTIDLTGTSNVFRAGHRIRLEVSSSNFPRFDRNLNTGRAVAADSDARVATNTVFHDARHASCVTLPVVERR